MCGSLCCQLFASCGLASCGFQSFTAPCGAFCVCFVLPYLVLAVVAYDSKALRFRGYPKPLNP